MDKPTPEDLNSLAVIISLGRCYDVLLAILSETSDNGARMAGQLQEMHKDGKLFFPVPKYTQETFDADTDE